MICLKTQELTLNKFLTFLKPFLNSVKWKIIVPIKGNFAKKTKGENVNK